MIVTQKQNKINSAIGLFYLYLAPIAHVMSHILSINSEILIALSVLIIIPILFIINVKNINSKFIIFAGIMGMLIFINYLASPEESEFVIEWAVKFLKFGVIPMYIMSNITTLKYFNRYWYRLAIVLSIVIMVFKNMLDFNYMSIGIYMGLNFIIVLYTLYKKGNIINVFILAIMYLFIFIECNRAIIITCTILVLYTIFKKLTKRESIVFALFIGTVALLIWHNLNHIVTWIYNFVEGMGIESYSLIKFMEFLEKGVVASSSGRDVIIKESLDLIYQNDFMPKGIGYFTYTTGIVYPHNFVIELLIVIGIFAVPLLIYVFYKIIKKYKSIEDKNIKFLVMMLTITMLIRISLSSSIFNELQLWYVIGIYYYNIFNENTPAACPKREYLSFRA